MSVAVFVATCAIPSHPSTELIDRVIRNARHWFPDAAIYVGADGIAPYQEAIPGRVEKYNEFRDVMSKRKDITFHRFETREHQTGMCRYFLPKIDAEFLLVNEHDCPIMTDRPIAWGPILSALRGGLTNVVRLPWWETDGVHPEHAHLSYGEFEHEGERFVRTKQWSGWPHITTTSFYRRMFEKWVPPSTHAMIENVIDQYALTFSDWFKIALWVAREGPTARFNHLDGRGYNNNGLRDERDA